MIFVKNPHSVLLALRHRPKEVRSIVFPKGEAAGAWDEIAQLVRENKVQIESGQTKGQKGNAQNAERGSGAGAWIQEKSPVSVEELFPPEADPSERGLWLALDEVQDPQNLGAIFRTAGFFGVKGIVLTDARSAGLTSVVYDVASGGVETVPFAVVSNLQRAIEEAKDRGLWVLGTSEHAKQSYAQVDTERAWLLVLGNEERGMRRLTIDLCDEMCTVPVTTEVDSLNVSAAAAVLISHFS